MDDGTDVVREIIKSITSQFLSLSPNKMLRYTRSDTPEAEVELKAKHYVFALFQALDDIAVMSPLAVTINRRSERLPSAQFDKLFRQSLIEKLPTMDEIIYHKATRHLDTHCIGTIVLIDDRIFRYKHGTMRMDSPGFRSFAKELRENLDSGCQFNSLNLFISYTKNHRAHANIIFTYKSDDKIYLALYEPHGASFPAVDHFVEAIKNTDPDTYIVIPRVKVSCPRGLQMESKDKVGYCLMFSYLWLFCLLSVITQLEENDIMIDFPEFIESIERIIIEENPNAIFRLVMNFSIFIVNSYIETIDREVQPAFVQKFMKKFDAILRFWELPTEKVGYVERREQIPPLEEEPPISPRKLDGEECDFDNECLSDHCVARKCEPYTGFG